MPKTQSNTFWLKAVSPLRWRGSLMYFRSALIYLTTTFWATFWKIGQIFFSNLLVTLLRYQAIMVSITMIKNCFNSKIKPYQQMYEKAKNARFLFWKNQQKSFCFKSQM